MNKKFLSLAISFLLFGVAITAQPIDQKATKETVALYNNLKKIATKGFLVGHQDDLAYGVHWRNEKGRSDVKDVTGDYPGIYGWELGGLEMGYPNDLDGVPFKKMKQYIKDAYARGGVITISWHVRNPLTNTHAWDTTHGTVVSILPGGPNHEKFKEWLDKVADFMLSLKTKKGQMIPVLFRPWHELTGNWFWWGPNNCTPEQFKILWNFTLYYLQEQKNVHNLLYVYNPADNFKTKEGFLERYPGNDKADVLSFDMYQYNDPKTDDGFINAVKSGLSILTELGKESGKPIAFAETGYEAIPYAEWWTKTLLPAISGSPISYVLMWRNHGYNESMKKMHYYVPCKGDVSADDFIKFYNDGRTLFERDAAREKMYE